VDVKQIAPCEKNAQEYAWYVQTGRIKSNSKFDPIIQKRMKRRELLMLMCGGVKVVFSRLTPLTYCIFL
jgi:hypothetical protein